LVDWGRVGVVNFLSVAHLAPSIAKHGESPSKAEMVRKNETV